MENNDIKTQLDKLKKRIEDLDFIQEAKAIKEWGGADVIIRKKLDNSVKNWIENQQLVVSLQNTEPTRRAVITEYSKELSWLFHQLKHIFSRKIDYISKYDFYGTLAQSAIDYLEKNKESKDMVTLLLTVLDASKEFVEK